MSRNIARAYQQFLSQEKKRKQTVDSSRGAMSATGLLAPRKSSSRPTNMNKQNDQIDTIIGFVDEIRKQGSRNRG